MQKQFCTNQQFDWEELDGDSTNRRQRHFLLMPNEVDEFKELLAKGLDYDYCFTRITGRGVYDSHGNRYCHNIELTSKMIQINAKKFEPRETYR